jgi:PKD repeat protein
MGVEVGFSVAASDADNDALAAGWDFGDGTTGEGGTVSHVYAASGVYNVTVNVADPYGGMATEQNPLTVRSVVPATASKKKFMMNFKSTYRDTLDVTLNSYTDLTFPDKTSFAATDGTKATVCIGNFPIDEIATIIRGKGTGKGKLTWNYKKGDLRYSLKKFNLQSWLAPYGAINANTYGQMYVPIIIGVNGKWYGGTHSFSYSAIKGKSGKGS